MTYLDPEDDDDHEPEPQIPQHLREAADKITDKASAFEDVARHIGLYVMQAGVTFQPGPEGPRPVLVADCMVGAEAFSDRTLNPHRYAEDGEFRRMKATFDEAADVRDRLRQATENGLNPFDDDDDE